ncbi:MAG: DegT/DnrJ/EryC1/StrS family aminotransferase, partial [Thermoanaerobaculia bacterium]
YDALLADAARAGRIGLPAETPGRRHVYHQYVVRVTGRDAVRRRLAERGVSTSVFYPIPLHLQECFRDLGGREGDFPEAERAAKEVLALPMFAELTDAEVERVGEAVLDSLG